MIVRRNTEYDINIGTLKKLIENVNDYYSTDVKCQLNDSMTLEEIIEACKGFEMCDIYDRYSTFYLEDLNNQSRMAIAREIKRLLKENK